MAETDFESVIGPELAGAIAKKGYTTLTPVQEAVLDPALAGRDLRISSQTGSGKTVAIGFTVRDVVSGDAAPTNKGAARPLALVVTPTRELAKQVETELSWLFAPLRVGVASVTGGGNYRDERRALGSGCAIVVGTPGRLLDHLQRGSIDGTNLGAVVLDEADRMLDLGFRDDLEAILAFAPAGHRTHLVSATFPREVLTLANRVQTDPVRIEGTPLGTANTDIEHLVHLVLPHERLDAIVNLMLETPDATTLIFARTRADVGELTHLLAEAGFTVDSLSGEMEQRERNKALAAFKRGDLHALVATDVAARGIDVQDVARVLHAEPPMDPDSYTHRSGRTGRAGRKGKSSVLVTPPALNRVSSLLKRAGVRWRIDPVPTAETIESAREDRLVEMLTRVPPAEDPAAEPAPKDEDDGFVEADERSWALAKRIVAGGEATRALARMISRTRSSGPEARRITVIEPPGARKNRPWENRDDRERPPAREARSGDARDTRDARSGSDARGPRVDAAPNARGFGERRPFDEHRSFGEPRGLRPDRAPGGANDERGDERGDGRGDERSAGAPSQAREYPGARREPGPQRTGRDAATDAGEWVSFRVSWGQIHGADARRLLAMACRRGGIRGSDVGSIRVARTFSTVDVAAASAAAFERAASEPDPRDPRVRITPAGNRGPGEYDGDREPLQPAPQRARAPRETLREASPEAKRERERERDPVADADVERPAVERPSKPADRPSVPADRASKTADRPSVPADRASKTADRASKTADRASKTADRASKTADRASAPADRPSKTADRASKTADRASAPPDRPSKTADRASKTADRASKTADRPSKAQKTEKTETEKTDTEKAPAADAPAKVSRKPDADRPSVADRPSRSAYADRRPRPSQPERYARRPQPKPGARPDHDRPRPPHDGPRSDGPRPPYDGPRSDGPRSDGPRPPHDGPRREGPRPPYDGPRREGPRPPHDGPRPPHDAPRSRPPYDGPRREGGPRPFDRARPQHDGPRPSGDRNDRPRPPQDGPQRSRPPQDGPPRPSFGRDDRPRPGARPSGPPSPHAGPRHGDARPKRKKP